MSLTPIKTPPTIILKENDDQINIEAENPSSNNEATKLEQKEDSSLRERITPEVSEDATYENEKVIRAKQLAAVRFHKSRSYHGTKSVNVVSETESSHPPEKFAVSKLPKSGHSDNAKRIKDTSELQKSARQEKIADLKLPKSGYSYSQKSNIDTSAAQISPRLEKIAGSKLPKSGYSDRSNSIADTSETQNSPKKLQLAISQLQKFSLSDPTVKDNNLKKKSPRAASTALHSHSIKKERVAIDKPTSVFSVRVPLALFMNCIDIPVVPYKTWKSRVVKTFHERIIKTDLSSDQFELCMQEVHKDSLKFSSILLRVSKSVELLKGIPEYRFLSSFAEQSNPTLFYKKFNVLKEQSETDGELLFQIIGMEEGFKIIRRAGGPKTEALKKVFQSEFNTTASISPLLRSSFIFQTGFDTAALHIVHVPIFLIHYGEFSDSFRAFYSDGPFPEDSIIINDQKKIIPNYKDLGVSEDAREMHFQTWLISTLQKEIQIDAKVGCEDQIKIFSEKVQLDLTPYQLMKLISKQFSTESAHVYNEKEIHERLVAIFDELHQTKHYRDFAEQMSLFSGFISKHLLHYGRFLDKDWTQVSYDLIGIYHRVHHFEKKNKSIPLQSLLKASSFPSYLICEMFLRTTVCPDLFDPSNPYLLVLDHDHLGRFDISAYWNSFDVKHMKAFKICTKSKVAANISLVWTVKGHLNSKEYSFALQFTRFDFQPDCTYEERSAIRKLFHLDCGNSPWGNFVKRVEMPQSFTNSFF
jgi:hypothetical protein